MIPNQLYGCGIFFYLIPSQGIETVTQFEQGSIWSALQYSVDIFDKQFNLGVDESLLQQFIF